VVDVKRHVTVADNCLQDWRSVVTGRQLARHQFRHHRKAKRMASTGKAKFLPVELPESAVAADQKLRDKLKATEAKLRGVEASAQDDRYALGRLRFYWCDIKGVTQRAYAKSVGVSASAVGQSITNFREAFPAECAKALAQPPGGPGALRSPKQVAAIERERKAKTKRARTASAARGAASATAAAIPQLDKKTKAAVRRKLAPFEERLNALVRDIYRTVLLSVDPQEHEAAFAEVRRFLNDKMEGHTTPALGDERQVA
jgi:hypothetical protein